MNYYDELLRRILGVEEIEIRLPNKIQSTPGPIIYHITTDDAVKPLQLVIELGKDRMTIILRAWDGSPLWIRHFNFIHTDG